MPAPTSIKEFMQLVIKSGLLPKDAAVEYLRTLHQTNDSIESPKQVAGCMVRDNKLTRFQAERILAGRWKGFILCEKYKLLNPIGSGGMGTVYRCEHLRLGRIVAIKVLPMANVQVPGTLERFYREARAVAALSHPNIVRAHDIDHEGDVHFLVMEYVEGNSLQAVVREKGPIDPTRAAQYIAQASLGLQHANDAGLIHRDIKPSNLLLDKSGTLKILDMGLARFFNDEHDELTKEHDKNAVLGTADYLAPEQAINSHQADTRADIYSLGVTFYYLLAGHAPFYDMSMHQKLIAHQMQKPKPISSLRSDVPPEMEAVLERMMAKAPDQRYQHPIEVAQALAQWANVSLPPPSVADLDLEMDPAESGILSPQGSSPQFQLPQELRPTQGLSGSDRAGGITRLHDPAATQTQMKHPEGSETNIATLDELESRLLFDPESPTTVEKNEQSSTLSEFDLRGSELEETEAIVSQPTLQVGTGTSGIFAKNNETPFWKRPLVVVSAGIAGLLLLIILLLSFPFDKETENGPKGRNPAKPVVKPKKTNYQPDLLRTVSRPEVIFQGHKGPVNSVAISSDGIFVASGSDDKTVKIWNAGTGKVFEDILNHKAAVTVVEFSPNGKLVASGDINGVIIVWHVDKRERLRTFQGPKSPIRHLAFSSNSAGVVSAQDKSVRLWTLGGPPKAKPNPRVLGQHQAAVGFTDYLLDGQRVISASNDGQVGIWDTQTAKKVKTWPLNKATGEQLLAVSPSRQFVVTGDVKGGLFLRDAHSGRITKTFFRDRNEKISRCEFTSDGRYLISLDQNSRTQLWNVVSGREVVGLNSVAFGKEPQHQPIDVACSSDGKTFVTGSHDALVRMWKLPAFTASPLTKLYSLRKPIQAPGLGVALLEDKIALVHQRKKLAFFRGANLQPWEVVDSKDIVLTIASSADGAHFATAGNKSVVYLWDSKKRQIRHKFKGHKGTVHQVRFSPNDQILGSVGKDGTVRLWNVRNGKPHRKPWSVGKPLRCLAFSPDQKFIAAGGDEKKIYVWDIKKRKMIRKWDTGHVVAELVYGQSNQLLTRSLDGKLKLWTIPGKGKPRALPLTGHRGPVTCLANVIRPSGHLGSYALSGSASGEVILWDLARRLPMKCFPYHKGRVTSVSFEKNEMTCASVGVDKTLRAWNLSRNLFLPSAKEVHGNVQEAAVRDFVTLPGDKSGFCTMGDNLIRKLRFSDGQVEKKYSGHTAEVLSIDTSPNGRYLLSASADRTLKIWESETGKEVQTLRGHSAKVTQGALSPDGRWVVSASDDGKVYLWSPGTDDKRGELKGHTGQVSAVAFSRDSQNVVTAGEDGNIRVYEVASQTLLRTLSGHKGTVRVLAISPDGRHCLSGGADKTLRLWALERNEPVHTFRDHLSAISAIAFSPDGLQGLCAEENGDVSYWDLFQKRRIAKIDLFQSPVTGIAFHRDGRHFVFTTLNGTIRTWSLPVELPISLLRKKKKS
ncbi:MAG: protein kinase [Gemmataceae bacterium]